MRSKDTMKSTTTTRSVTINASKLNDGIAALPCREQDRTISSSTERRDSFLNSSSSSSSVDFEVVSSGAEMALARAIQGLTYSPALAIEKGQLGRMLRNDAKTPDVALTKSRAKKRELEAQVASWRKAVDTTKTSQEGIKETLDDEKIPPLVDCDEPLDTDENNSVSSSRTQSLRRRLNARGRKASTISTNTISSQSGNDDESMISTLEFASVSASTTTDRAEELRRGRRFGKRNRNRRASMGSETADKAANSRATWISQIFDRGTVSGGSQQDAIFDQKRGVQSPGSNHGRPNGPTPSRKISRRASLSSVPTTVSSPSAKKPYPVVAAFHDSFECNEAKPLSTKTLDTCAASSFGSAASGEQRHQITIEPLVNAATASIPRRSDILQQDDNRASKSAFNLTQTAFAYEDPTNAHASESLHSMSSRMSEAATILSAVSKYLETGSLVGTREPGGAQNDEALSHRRRQQRRRSTGDGYAVANIHTATPALAKHVDSHHLRSVNTNNRKESRRSSVGGYESTLAGNSSSFEFQRGHLSHTPFQEVTNSRDKNPFKAVRKGKQQQRRCSTGSTYPQLLADAGKTPEKEFFTKHIDSKHLRPMKTKEQQERRFSTGSGSPVGRDLPPIMPMPSSRRIESTGKKRRQDRRNSTGGGGSLLNANAVASDIQPKTHHDLMSLSKEETPERPLPEDSHECMATGSTKQSPNLQHVNANGAVSAICSKPPPMNEAYNTHHNRKKETKGSFFQFFRSSHRRIQKGEQRCRDAKRKPRRSSLGGAEGAYETKVKTQHGQKDSRSKLRSQQRRSSTGSSPVLDTYYDDDQRQIFVGDGRRLSGHRAEKTPNGKSMERKSRLGLGLLRSQNTKPPAYKQARA